MHELIFNEYNVNTSEIEISKWQAQTNHIWFLNLVSQSSTMQMLFAILFIVYGFMQSYSYLPWQKITNWIVIYVERVRTLCCQQM